MYSSPAHRSPLVKHPLSRTDSSNRDLVYDYPPVPPAPAVYSSGEKPLINFESDGESECDESLLQEVKSLKHSRVLQQSPIPPPPAPQRNMDLILSPQVQQSVEAHLPHERRSSVSQPPKFLNSIQWSPEGGRASVDPTISFRKSISSEPFGIRTPGLDKLEQIENLLQSSGYHCSFIDPDTRSVSTQSLRDSVHVLVRDMGHMKELFERLDSENKEKSQILRSQTKQLAYSGKVKNKAIRKYRSAKQQLAMLISSAEDMKNQQKQTILILKQQEQKIYELTKELGQKDVEIAELRRLAQKQGSQINLKLEDDLSQLQKDLEEERKITAKLEKEMASFTQRTETEQSLIQEKQGLILKNQELGAIQAELVKKLEQLDYVLKEMTTQDQSLKRALGAKENECEGLLQKNRELEEQLAELRVQQDSWREHSFAPPGGAEGEEGEGGEGDFRQVLCDISNKSHEQFRNK